MIAPVDLVMVGAGGHARELHLYIQDLNAQSGRDAIHLLGAIDERKTADPSGALPVLGDFRAFAKLAADRHATALHYITATGDNATRRRFVHEVDGMRHAAVKAWTLRHPHSIVGGDAVVGEGSCVAPGVVITSGVRVGRHCILNVKVSLSHDCQLGDWVNVNPNATICGNARIGDGCYIGAGATVIDKVSVGEWSVIGAGAVVVSDIPPRVTAVGVPARIIKHHAEDGR